MHTATLATMTPTTTNPHAGPDPAEEDAAQVAIGHYTGLARREARNTLLLGMVTLLLLVGLTAWTLMAARPWFVAPFASLCGFLALRGLIVQLRHAEAACARAHEVLTQLNAWSARQ